ncbi:MAG: hypothetical protein GY940_12770, partial [bacterium]|nr:hypothetical protein [bacterium]
MSKKLNPSKRNTAWRFYPGLILSVLFLLSFFPSLFLTAQEKEQGVTDSREYEVSVSAQLVPIFAVDGKGNPVYDLKQEEITLYVNGKKATMMFFDGYRLESESTGGPKPKPSETPVKAKAPERINFIIIDCMISNLNTFGPSRAIAWQIIQKASPGDSFVILESNQETGFQYVAGPEKDKTKLAASLDGISRGYKRRLMRNAAMRNLASAAVGQGAGDEYNAIMKFTTAGEAREREKYREDVRRFSRSLKQLKYALKSTSLAKSVFLISGRVMNLNGGENPVTYLGFLEEARQT